MASSHAGRMVCVGIGRVKYTIAKYFARSYLAIILAMHSNTGYEFRTLMQS